MDSFSQIGQPTTLVRSCSWKSPLFTHQQQPQPVAAEGTSGEHPQETRRDPDPPEDPDIWKVIFSFKESFDLLCEYFGNQLEVGISSYGPGSLFIIVTCSSLEILERLWEDYRSGHLNEVAEEILITKQVLEKLSLREVKLKTIIKEEDYKKCKESFVGTDQVGPLFCIYLCIYVFTYRFVSYLFASLKCYPKNSIRCRFNLQDRDIRVGSQEGK